MKGRQNRCEVELRNVRPGKSFFQFNSKITFRIKFRKIKKIFSLKKICYFFSEDRGQWTCLLTDAEHLGTNKATIDIEVAVPAKVRLDSGFGDLGILRITEGKLAEVRFFIFNQDSSIIKIEKDPG